MSEYLIGQAAKELGLSVDTLRYYERRGLLLKVPRNASGLRIYTDAHLSRLRFVRRAQRMKFKLDEICLLLKMRQEPQRARDDVRRLTEQKLEEIEASLTDLTTLRDELRLLVNLCRASEDGCPILDEIAVNGQSAT